MESIVKSILRARLAVFSANGEQPERLKELIQQYNFYSTDVKADTFIFKANAKALEIMLRIINPPKPMQKNDKRVNHGARAHALLSASGASRWIACTPSARLEEGFENKSSEFAEEGTLAHEFAELNLKRDLKLISKKDYTKETEPYKANKYYFPEMEEYVQIHVDYVKQQFKAAKKQTPGAVLLIEQKVDLTHLIEEGYGTCDDVIIADGVLEVIDLKFGMGLRVSAEDNSQLKLYGLGALEAYEMLYDIHMVRLTITQPRLDSISSWEISADDLRLWGEEVVKPKALEAYAGEGEQVTGNHCKFCRASARCKAQAEQALATAKEDFTDPQLMSDSELIEVYKKIPNIDAWFKKVASYMYEEALAGKTWPEHKLVDGQSRRGWSDEETAKALLRGREFKDIEFMTSKIKGIGEIEKLVGKKEFPSLLGDVVAFKKTSPSLVHISDKRPAMGIEQAKEDFATEL